MAISVMASDIIMQVLFIFTLIFMFLWTLNIPQNLFNNFRYRDRSIYAAKRHFVLGADLLSRSRSTGDRNLAKSAAEHADKSISINPNDAAVHILKALALDLQGFTTSALEALEAALSPLTAKSLSDGERSDALCKRAEIKMKIGGGGGGGGGVDAAVVDLVEAVRLNGGNAAALRLLGECYEKKGMSEEALKMYVELLKVEPRSAFGQDAVKRLRSG
ncbi:putative tetratricopeptide-like helical domain superfamily [Helianthus anomalus]